MSIDTRISTVLVIMFVGFGFFLWRHHFFAETSRAATQAGPIGFVLRRPA